MKTLNKVFFLLQSLLKDMLRTEKNSSSKIDVNSVHLFIQRLLQVGGEEEVNQSGSRNLSVSANNSTAEMTLILSCSVLTVSISCSRNTDSKLSHAD